MLAWIRHWREIRRIEREERRAYLAWRRLIHEQGDTLTVHGIWSREYEAVGLRRDEAYAEYTRLRLQRERLEECGP